MTDAVHPNHYRPDSADDIEAVIEGLPAREAAILWNILKYWDRRNDKGCKQDDLGKANNYAHRLVTGEWREEMKCKKSKTSTVKIDRVLNADGMCNRITADSAGDQPGKTTPAHYGSQGR